AAAPVAVASAESAAPPPNPPPAAPPPAPAPDDTEGHQSKSMIPVYVGAAVTAIGAGMWIGVGIAASNARDEVTALQRELGESNMPCTAGGPPECQQLQDAVDRQHSNATLAKVGIAVTAVGGVSTLAYVLFWPNHKTATTVTARSSLQVRPDVAFGPAG